MSTRQQDSGDAGSYQLSPLGGSGRTYHDCEPLRSNIEREDFESVRNEHRCIRDIIEEVKDENERNYR